MQCILEVYYIHLCEFLVITCLQVVGKVLHVEPSLFCHISILEGECSKILLLCNEYITNAVLYFLSSPQILETDIL